MLNQRNFRFDVALAKSELAAGRLSAEEYAKTIQRFGQHHGTGPQRLAKALHTAKRVMGGIVKGAKPAAAPAAKPEPSVAKEIDDAIASLR